MHFIDFSKKKISESINFIFDSESESDELNLKINDLKNIYKSIINDDSILNENKIDISKFFSFYLRTKMKDWLIDFLSIVILNIYNKEANSDKIVNNTLIADEFILNKNKILLISYHFIDLIEFNCQFFDNIFNIENFKFSIIEDTLNLMDNSIENINNVFKIKNTNKKNNKMMNYVSFKKDIVHSKNYYCFNFISNRYFFIKKNNKIEINEVFKVFIDIFFSLEINNIDIKFNSSNINDIRNEFNRLFSIYNN